MEAHGGLARWTPFSSLRPIRDHVTDDPPIVFIVFIVDPEPSVRKTLARSALRVTDAPAAD